MGSYSQSRLISAELRPTTARWHMDYHMAAAMMVKGMTAQYLIRSCFDIKSGDVILIQAVAGGVGLISMSVGKAFRRNSYWDSWFK